MTDEQNLLEKIAERRKRITSYVNDLEPRSVRVTNWSIILAGAATVFTGVAGSLVQFTKAPGVGVICCVLGALCSTWGGILTALNRAHDIADRLNKAHICSAKLDGLQTRLQLHQIDIHDAVTEYENNLRDTNFILSEDRQTNRWRPPDSVTGEIKIDSCIDGKISCSGCVKDFGQGLKLWIIVRINSSIWPKEGSISVQNDGTWRKNIVEDSTTKNFALDLFVTNVKGSKHIQKWIDLRDRYGTYPASFKRVRGMIRIDTVNICLNGENHPEQ